MFRRILGTRTWQRGQRWGGWGGRIQVVGLICRRAQRAWEKERKIVRDWLELKKSESRNTARRDKRDSSRPRQVRDPASKSVLYARSGRVSPTVVFSRVQRKKVEADTSQPRSHCRIPTETRPSSRRRSLDLKKQPATRLDATKPTPKPSTDRPWS